MTGLLASVTNLPEARLALEAGADIIDLKAPQAGALGALSLNTIRNIVAELGRCRPLSATIGDLPMEPVSLARAASDIAATGVHYVKIGFFPGGDWRGSLEALATLSGNGFDLVAVLFADDHPELRWLDPIAAAGFAGVMLDTRHKGSGSLVQHCPPGYLAEFVCIARAHRLMSGLAGSLQADDIPTLLKLAPDYLGFRGALCRLNRRTAEIDPDALRAIRALIPANRDVTNAI